MKHGVKRLTLLSLIPLLMLSFSAFADVDGDLNKFFDGLGMVSNTTAPHAFQGQQAGYYSGGSLYARNTVRNVQLVQVDLPSFRSGCGGIDMFAGGFSFVDNDEDIAAANIVLNFNGSFAVTETTNVGFAYGQVEICCNLGG